MLICITDFNMQIQVSSQKESNKKKKKNLKERKS